MSYARHGDVRSLERLGLVLSHHDRLELVKRIGDGRAKLLQPRYTDRAGHTLGEVAGRVLRPRRRWIVTVLDRASAGVGFGTNLGSKLRAVQEG